MAKKREQEQPPLSRTDLLGGENQAIQRLIGAHARTQPPMCISPILTPTLQPAPGHRGY
ncbi:hypothetical protein [Candidatus Amarolinea dominans]|uniref:hypothetical protein n=1 Tax=Candidatus Amarolinea dominans TaxID=3140696 RepID=UPI003135522F|nr:hypothetical protein [Anaerolineae bacterium]